MAFLYSGPSSNAVAVAQQIDQQAANAVGLTTAWRTAINSGAAVDSEQAASVYQALVSLRAYVQANGGVVGLVDAYKILFPGAPAGYNPVAEWGAVNTAITNFGTWFAANWPERSASNKPAFSRFQAGTGVLERFTVNLDPAARATLIGLLDAVLAAFAPG